jgi:hypothetical protein
MIPREIRYKDGIWMELTQYSVQRRALVLAVIRPVATTGDTVISLDLQTANFHSCCWQGKKTTVKPRWLSSGL